MGLFRRRDKGTAAAGDPLIRPPMDSGPNEPALSDQVPTTVQDSTESATVSDAKPETIGGWVKLYARRCREVHAAADACAETASYAIAARDKAAEPQHPLSSEAFIGHAQTKEKELKTLYGAFEEACSKARETASQLRAAADEDGEADRILLKVAPEIGPHTLEDVLQVQAILRSSFGSSPATFIEGVEHWYHLAGNPDVEDGFIYTPRAPSADERTCPWCAETIDARASTCRFCGRDAQETPNAL